MGYAQRWDHEISVYFEEIGKVWDKAENLGLDWAKKDLVSSVKSMEITLLRY